MKYLNFFFLQDGIVNDGLTDVYNKIHMVRTVVFHIIFVCYHLVIVSNVAS
jgi:hypothetical protein